MTLPHRRDKDVKNASVIAGLRLEPELALKLTAYALDENNFTRDKRGRTDVAEAARFLLHLGLGSSRDAAIQLGQGPHPSHVVPGLRLGRGTVVALQTKSDQLGLNRAATIRHLMRIQLGWSTEASLEVEDKFASIAEARRALAEAYR